MRTKYKSRQSAVVSRQTLIARVHVSRFTFHVSHPLRRLAEPAAVTLLFTLLTLLMTWPWALHMEEAINPFGDVVLQMTSLRWNAHALTTNPLGLFEAPFFYPYAHSLSFSDNLLGQTLTALPLLLLTGNPALALNFNILLSFVLTGVFTYGLVRDLTGSRTAGILSGVAFAFCQFRFMQMGHLHILSTQWFPFTLWALRKGLGVRKDEAQESAVGSRQLADPDRKSSRFTFHVSRLTARSSMPAPSPIHIGLAALGFIIMGLSSVYYVYFLALAVALYLGWWLVVEVGWRGLRSVAWGPLSLQLGLAALAVGAALGPVYLPYLQTGNELGFSRSTYEVENWAADWGYYGKVMGSNWLYGKTLAPGMASALGERQLFPGIVATLLAAVGVLLGRGRSRFFYLLLGLAALVLTFGLDARIPFTSREIPLPYAFLYDWVPGFKALRVPVRFAVLVDLALYVLAGFGLARLLGARDAQPTRTSRFTFHVSRNAVIAASFTALVLLESINPLQTDNRQDVMAQLATSEPYGWLSRPENRGPVLELPMTADQDDVWYTFFATRHWQPLVNGWSGFVPPGTVHLKRALDAFPSAETVALLQGLEVRHVVMHLWRYPQEAQTDLTRRLGSTPQLELAYREGETYVYRLAPDPWLRRMAETVGSGALWVGEPRQGAMPTLEALAYLLERWKGEGKVAGNIKIGYRPVGSLPFGTPADFMMVPNIEGGENAPFGYGDLEVVESNPAVRLLRQNPTIIKSYDLTAPDAPRLEGNNVQMQVGASGVTFGNNPIGETATSPQALDIYFVSFSIADVEIRVGDETRSIKLPVGISHYLTPHVVTPGSASVTVMGQAHDTKILRVDLSSDTNSKWLGDLRDKPTLMPVEIASTWQDGNFNTDLRVVPPSRKEQFTVTLDVYVEPWGTHPDGHFGSWSVVLPADGAAHRYNFRLDPITKAFSTVRDGAPTETFGWTGPPTEGDFRATLTVLNSKGQAANVPIYSFTRQGNRLTTQTVEPPMLIVTSPADE